MAPTDHAVPARGKSKDCSHLVKNPHSGPASWQILQPHSSQSLCRHTGVHISLGGVASTPSSPASPPHPTSVSTWALGSRGRSPELTSGSDRRLKGTLRARGAFQVKGALSPLLRAGAHKSSPLRGHKDALLHGTLLSLSRYCSLSHPSMRLHV